MNLRKNGRTTDKQNKTLKLDAGHSIECKLTPATRSPSMFMHFVTLWPWPLTF